MGKKANNPRSGSMQYWPRKRAKRIYAKVRSWPNQKEAKVLGFAGYKVGMCHAMVTDNLPNSMTKGDQISVPVTVVECPPIKAASIRFYKKTPSGSSVVSEIFADNIDKELGRKISIPKKVNKKIEDIKEYDEIRLNVYTQPKMTGIGKKKPELFELGVGGNKEDQLKYCTSVLGKEIKLADVFAEGDHVDIRSITKARGVQGPVRRFGIGIRSHKSEKGIRTPGSLGGWKAQGHVMYRVPMAGKMGFHQRTEYNKWILKIYDDAKEVNPKAGWHKYGVVKNTCILLKGSVGGPRKRIIRFNSPIRPNSKIPKETHTINNLMHNRK